MKKNDQKNTETGLEIAIIGMSGKFPGAANLDQFWENLKNGIESISFFSTEELKECGIGDELLNNPDYVKAYGILSGKENFDASFFGFSPKEAESIDPQIRLFLECSWETLEDAGYDPTSYKGAIGLYGGISDGFSWRMARVFKELRTGAGQTAHILDTSLLLSTRVSHKLDLKGPSITLYTACSTSLVAVHQASRALLTGECDMALAGAVSAQPIVKTGYLYQEGMILSPDGHNRSFDAQAKGTIFSEGIGIVLLKRLKDAQVDGDNIKSVIKASAVNNDGTGKSSFTAPGKKRIADVIRTALKLSRLAPENISYVETHGTATDLGDAIEIEALKEAFSSAKKAYCAIGSVKSNLGHLDVAAGMAGLIKTVQAIQQRQIPASLYFKTPNPKIDFIDSPFYINTTLFPWEDIDNPLKAGVCSFGIGGTNAFILLEESPVHTEPADAAIQAITPAVPHLLLLSARTDSALETMAQNLAGFFKDNPGINLANVAYTLQVGRKVFNRRRMIICTNTMEAISALTDGVAYYPGNESEPFELLRKIGVAWLENGVMNWESFYGQQPGYTLQKKRRISLPTYPFERQRYWIDGLASDPLSIFSSLSQEGRQRDAGLSLAKIEKSGENETPGLYQRPDLSTVYEPPSDEIELALIKIWQRFFGIRDVGVLDDFFELGGDSLKVITVVTEIHKQMNARVPIPQVFDTPTIKGLAGYIKSKSSKADKYAAIEPIEEKEYYPLSSVQMRIYILQQLEIDSTGYNTPLLFILGGQVDCQRVESVFQSLVARHESLRTSFELIDGEVVQRIHREVDFEIEYNELAAKNAKFHEEKIGAIIQSFIRPFDISCAPLIRVGLTGIGNDSYLFMVDMHHSITDGSSIGILIREFAALYAGESLPELRIQYRDYTHWQSSDKQREAVKTQEAYWLETFTGELPILNLPLDYARPPLQSFAGKRTPFVINIEEARALRSLALNEDVTLFMVLFSLYNILLAKTCGQEDIVIGTPIAGRNHSDLQRMIGMLVNTLALRNAPIAEKTFREFLKEIKKNTLAAFQNQDYLFEDLVELITRQINRDVSRNPVFDTIFNLLNFESQYENVKITVTGMTLQPYEYERGIAIFDLSLEATDTGTEITFNFEFCTRLFKPETIDRFIGYFKKIVRDVIAAPNQKLAQIEILTAEEKQQILYDCSGPQIEFEGELFIHDLFQRQVEKIPDHIALIAAHELHELSELLEFQEISYGELHERSDKGAMELIEKGILVGDIVGIMLPRSIEMVIAILAILKAGGAYLPIDPELPGERINYMLKDSGVKLLAVANELEGEKVRGWEGKKVLLETISQSPKNSSYPLTFLPSYLQNSNLIYIIYTSGSTGRPKGVMLEHGNVRNLLLYQYRYTPIDFSRVLQFTTISFDVSFQEIFSTLLAGGMLLLAGKEIIRDFPRLFRVIEQNVVKTLFLPASFLKFIFNLEEYVAIFPSCVRHIVTAGEQPIVTDCFNNYLKSNGIYFHNHYGPTETHVVTTLVMDPAGEIPTLPSIGKPLANTQIYIVDKNSHLVPIGMAGELFIGGVQVGRGYLNNPELTAEKFNINKINRSYRSNKTYILYKTGDLARWLNDGNIEFLGRIDFQVKIRGYRIELGEIESCLLAVDYVKEAVVIAGTDPKGEIYLCAYIVPLVPLVPGQVNKKTATELRNTLLGVLPEYMVPSYFIYLDKIPLTVSGKVNRKALPEPIIDSGVDVNANLIPVEKRDYYPLSSAQKRLYIIQQLAPGSVAYNMPSAMIIEERIDKLKLEKAFRQLIQRHESFRTSFVTLDDQPVQRVQQDAVFKIEYKNSSTDYTDYTDVKDNLLHHSSFSIQHYIQSFIRPFNLTYAPLLRVRVGKLEEAKYLMIVDMHHIIGDGVSMSILMREFWGLYRGEVLPGLRLQYKDYVQWQNSDAVKRKTKLQGKYWLREFRDIPPGLELPTDFIRPKLQSFEGSIYYFELEREENTALNRLAQEQGVTLYILLLTLFNIFLFKLSGREDIIIGTVTAGRGHADLEPVIGMFVNTLALRNFPEPNKTIIEFLQEVKARTLLAFENQDFPFENLVEKVVLKRDPGRNPLFDVMFSLQNVGILTNPGKEKESEGLLFNAGRSVSHFDMTWFVTEKESALVFSVEYCIRLFMEQTIQKFGAYFKKIINDFLAEPTVHIGDIIIILEEERQLLLYEFNNLDSLPQADKTVPELFIEQAERTPDHIALANKKAVHESHDLNEFHEITYRELDEKSKYLAHVLKEKGIQADNIVALNIDRCIEMIIGVLGILKAGGAYLPIDPDFPQERIDYMLKDSGVKLLAVANGLEGEKVRRWEGEKVLLEEISISPKSSSYPLTLLPSYLLSPGNLAYIIYTSGTTGRPKGVLVEHRNLAAYVCAFLHEFKLGPSDINILEASFIFDAFVEEVYPILMVGGRLCIAQKQEVMDAQLLEAFILRNNITLISCSPMLLNQVNQFANFKNLSVHTFISGADVLNKEYIGNLLGFRTIYNVYGPSETTVCALYYRVPENITSTVSNIPIGKAFKTYQVYILDDHDRIQHMGTPGEICIAGCGVTRGYLNNPELTCEKFKIDRSFSSNKYSIIYKTGDLGRWVPDPASPGSYVIEFLGRIDRQVKLRGFRIELGEIECQLLQQGSVKEVVVVDREDENKDKYLCAYIIPKTGTTWNPVALKEFLSTRLPAYMIPAYFVCLNRFPLTAGGKLDRRALPVPTIAQALPLIQEEVLEVRTVKEIDGIETKLIILWAEVLGVDRRSIGSGTNFFEIGGHSLKATVLCGKIHKVLGVRVPLAELFRKPTVKGLAGYIKGTKEEAFFAVEPVEKRDYYPLSSAQKRLYVLQQMDLESAVYNMPSAMIMIGEIDKQKLSNTFYRLIQRHESFRTSFITINDEPMQKIYENVEFEIEYKDCSSSTDYTNDTDEKNNASQHSSFMNTPDYFIHSFIHAFDLSKAPLLRVSLIKLAESKHLLMVDIHHIINDGVSTRILLREFGELYRGKTFPGLRLQYKDYAAWQNSEAVKLKVKNQEKYWLEEFSNEVSVLTLPTDFSRPALQSFIGSNFHFELGQEKTGALNKLALEQGATLFMVLISIFNIMLAKLSSQEDIVIGVPIAGRKHADLEQIIGIFVNTLALRNFPAGNKTFNDFLQEVRARTLKAFENEDCQFEELVDRLALKREADRNPLFDVMFALLNKSEQKLEKDSAETALKVYECEFENTVSRFDMSWNIIELNNRLDITIEYSTRLFKRETIERITSYFKKILETIITESAGKIAGIEIMPHEELQCILYEFNNTSTEYPRDKTIQQLFAEQVRLAPDHIAVVGESAGTIGPGSTGPISMSYGQLNEWSDRLGITLIKKGVQPGDIIGIIIKRSLDMILCLLGILKSGGAYLPIDPEYPGERIDYMLEDSNIKLMAVINDQEGEKVRRWEGEIVLLESILHPANHHFYQHSAFSIQHSNHLAYVIYTSGTTGKPKGVMVEHRGVVRLVKNTNYLIFNQNDRILPTGALEFDISTFETWGPLLNGLCIYLVSKETLLNISTLGNLLSKYNIAILHLIPQLFNRVADQDPTIFHGLNYLLVGGDRVNRESIELVRKRCPSVKIRHMYGPTENTTFSSFLPVDREYDTNLPIGRPIANSTAYILDKYGQPVPLGVIGELCVGGDGVARGYLNNLELTAERFKINRSYRSNKTYILYKTGDLARWLSEGVIEFIGRSDYQVKVRGIRVELGEIENSLLKHKSVKEAVVIDRKDEKGETYLCAYIVPANDTVVDAELREYLTSVLPRNMIPAYFIFLEKIPLTTVGKIDRRSLPEPKFQVNEERIGPIDKIEECLMESWSQVLSLEKEKIGRNANFFALGGHSLKATVLLAKIHKELDVKVPVAELFKTPTIEGLAGYIREAKEEAFFAVEAIEEREYYPLSSAQRRIYLLQQMDLESIVYNMPFIVKLDTILIEDKLEKMVGYLIQRHESFRTSFQTVNEEPVQRIHKEAAFTIKYHEFAAIDQKAGVSAFIHKFDLSRAPLLRFEVIKLAENKSIFIADMHHIISDGFSMDILLREFPAIYEGEQLPPLRIQYKDYTYWQTSKTVREKIKDQEEFWLKEFQDDIPILDLPFDYCRPQVQSFAGSFLNFALSREETDLLKKLALEENVTLYLLLVTIFNILLYKLSGQEDIVIGTPIAGRRHADLQAIIGMFVNTLLLRNFPSGNKTFMEFLEEIKTRALRAFENQDYQFEDLVEKVSVGRDPSRNPLFDVMFTWQELVNKKDDIGSHLYEGHVSRFDMTWFASERDKGITLGIEYCTKLFKPETMIRFSNYFKKIVSYIVAAPNVGIGEIDILSDKEKQQLLYDFNSHDREYPANKTIPHLFQEQVEKTSDHIAIFSESVRLVGFVRPVGQVSLTYSELNKQSNHLAGLLTQKDVQPGDIVGIIIGRSTEMITGILGILKSGCAYLPINPGFPHERIDYMLRDSGVKLLAVANGLEGEKVRRWEGETMHLEEISKFQKNSSYLLTFLPSYLLNPSTLAYIIYTSGSTGKPKGVPITHANLSPLLHWGYLNLGINEKDRAIQNLSYYFDWSVWEIFIILTQGASLFMITEELLLNPEKSVAFIRQHAITVLHVTPTQYRYYLAAGQKLETLRYLFIGAEALGFELVRRSFQSVNENCRVFNMYGPTEATIIASVLEIERPGLENYKGLSNVPLGRTVGNTDFLILDKHNNLCPINVAGELYISGGGLACGYLNNPELTAEKFFAHELHELNELKQINKSFAGVKGGLFQKPSLVTYKTGDLARWLPDGCVEFLGRSDFQVKIRGYRIELGEIENRLVEHPEIREALVLALKPIGKESDEKYLCAYIVLRSGNILNTAELKEFLSRSLPDYMIPSYFVSIDHIPLNANGKVDRGALPDPNIDAGDNYEAPRSEIEWKLVDIWSETLALDRETIGINDNFFERGGHSLKAAILVSRIQKEFSIAVPLVEVFKSPTVKGLGQYIDSMINRGEIRVPALEDENLVLLRKNDPGSTHVIPLFFIHAGSGEVEVYIELCSRLNSCYNCWGLRVDRVDRTNYFVPWDLNIQDLALKYIKAVKKVQPTGPYFILGWSIGGIIAFEMVRQLDQNGEIPGILYLVDAYAPLNKFKGRSYSFNISSELSFLKSLKIPSIDRQLIKELKNAVDIPQMWQHVVRNFEERKVTVEMLKKIMPKNIVHAIPMLQSAASPDQSEQLREFIYYLNVIRSLSRAREMYNPKISNNSKIKTDAYFWGAAGSEISNEKQWSDYFEKPVKYYEIEGDHFSIFKMPNVITFAEKFNQIFIME